MAQSIYRGFSGPFVPLGLIVVQTPGTPVRFTSLIDATALNAPETGTPAASANNTGAATSSNEWTVTCQQIIIQAAKSNSGNGLAANTGNIYIMLKGASGGLGNRTDYGAMVGFLTPGQTLILASAPVNCNVFNPYQLWLDADNGNDGALITLEVQ
jgi:hypothetical protein